MNAWTLAVQQLQAPITLECYGEIRLGDRPKHKYANNNPSKAKRAIIDGEEHKTCSKCHKMLPFSAYHNNKSSSDGRVAKCKDCFNTYHRQWYHMKEPPK